MRKIFFALSFMAVIGFSLAGCDNFQEGSDLQEQIKLSVYNSKYKPNLIVMLGDSNGNYGTIKSYKENDDFHEYRFEVYDEYEFKYWIAARSETGVVLSCSDPADPIYIENTEDLILKYRLNVSSAKMNITILPGCIKRPVVKKYSPVFPDDGLKNYPSIQIEFEDDILTDKIDDHIEIFTRDGENSDQTVDLKQYFSSVQISDDKKSIRIDPRLDENKLPLSAGELKTITVRLSGIKREGLILGAFPSSSEMKEDFVWTYVIKG